MCHLPERITEGHSQPYSILMYHCTSNRCNLRAILTCTQPCLLTEGWKHFPEILSSGQMTKRSFLFPLWFWFQSQRQNNDVLKLFCTNLLLQFVPGIVFIPVNFQRKSPLPMFTPKLNVTRGVDLSSWEVYYIMVFLHLVSHSAIPTGLFLLSNSLFF